MRRPLIIANWKMHTRLPEAEMLLSYYKNEVREHKNIDIVICPPALWLVPLKENLSRGLTHIELGAQNTYFEQEGAFTGEISAEMLKGIAKYVIVGHSERRKLFGETLVDVVKKIKNIITNNLTPIVCFGELSPLPLKQRTWGKPIAVDRRNTVYKELEYVIKELKQKELEKIIIAYEPVWAIGTGEAATSAYANAVVSGMREFITEISTKKLADEVRILYGGSVDAKNVQEFMHQPEIDGVLVGTAALKVRQLAKICEIASESTRKI